MTACVPLLLRENLRLGSNQLLLVLVLLLVLLVLLVLQVLVCLRSTSVFGCACRYR